MYLHTHTYMHNMSTMMGHWMTTWCI